MDRECSAAWFTEAAGARLEGKSTVFLKNVETDSRLVKSGDLFVALKGERVDGHDYAVNAIHNGAGALLVSSEYWQTTGQNLETLKKTPIIIADDPLNALQRAAKAWRKLFPDCYRIGITGSSGKTTVKEMVWSVISQGRKTVKNPGNLNSDIGLPASIFRMNKDDQVAVFEMGINRPGEMELLAEIYEPDLAIINNIGTAHIGPLGGSQEKIAEEKHKICSRFDGSQILLLPEDEPYRQMLAKDTNGRIWYFGAESIVGFESAESLGDEGWKIRYDGCEFKLELPGKHNLHNAFAAIRAGEILELKTGDICEGLASVKAMEGRTRIIRKKYTIIDDSYNANEESSMAVISFCEQLPCVGKRIYVLGAMKELGASGPGAHARVGAAAARSRAAALLFYGEEASSGYEAARAVQGRPRLHHFTDMEALEETLLKLARTGDLVLVKGSRSLGLERIVEILVENGGPDVS